MSHFWDTHHRARVPSRTRPQSLLAGYVKYFLVFNFHVFSVFKEKARAVHGMGAPPPGLQSPSLWGAVAPAYQPLSVLARAGARRRINRRMKAGRAGRPDARKKARACPSPRVRLFTAAADKETAQGAEDGEGHPFHRRTR